ncbi:CocE/NonD family hydrolase [Microbacterium sp. RD1]|uniref:CocE/NonD family hydrolase n=1 Tax=Microbacterium sp. RD1 TaxID=3457313 RepID=UPI003FA5E631
MRAMPKSSSAGTRRPILPDSVVASVRLLKDVEIRLRDGVVLRADVFTGLDGAPQPVILTMGPYGKDIHFEDFNPAAFATIEERGPYLNWETVNPAWWVPQGYTVVRVDERGTGRSEGRMHLLSPREFEDYVEVVEWAADQPWSTGDVGLMGISYYSINQWQVAARRPRGLRAIVPWEGLVDLYREFHYHGGIRNSGFSEAWWVRQITGNQNGLGDADPRQTLPGNVDLMREQREHAWMDDYYAERTADLSRIEVPLLSAGNWGGYALHLRGNIEGYLAAGSTQKWLEVHAGNHFAPFYSSESRAYQKRFLDHFLKGAQNGWDDEPPVKLFIRDSRGGTWRYEDEWPLARTIWTTFALDAGRGALSTEPSADAEISFPGLTGGVEFLSEPLTEDLEVTGPSALRLWVSSTTSDADLFVTLDNIRPDGTVATFEDASGLQGPVTKGWLRASHRVLDADASTEYRPVHAHRGATLLVPGEPTLLEIEIMPTSMIFEKGHRIRLSVKGGDDGENTRFLHDDPVDRDPARLGGTVTVYTGGSRASSWLAPVIPDREGRR